MLRRHSVLLRLKQPLLQPKDGNGERTFRCKLLPVSSARVLRRRNKTITGERTSRYEQNGDFTCQHFIFEVTGSHPNFKRNVVKADPRNSQSFVRMIFMDTVSSGDIATVQNVARTTKIDNETVEWDCQEYVLDMLETLEEECVVEDDDETYKEAKKELKKKRGAIV